MLLYVDSQFLSPYAMSVYVALREKALLFRVQPLDLAAGAAGEGGVFALAVEVAGADDHLAKPIRAAALIAAMHSRDDRPVVTMSSTITTF